MDDFRPISGEFMLRPACVSGDKPRTMILGVVDGHLTGDRSGEIWIGQFIPAGLEKFQMPKGFDGWKADQLLTHPFDITKLEKVTL